MIEQLRNIVNKKWFHLIIIIVIFVILLFILGMTILKYNVEGETNMPFKLSKISIISTIEGNDKQSENNKWAFDVNQNNDVYIYIEKNQDYDKTEIIKSVVLDNFNVEKQKQLGEIKIFKPDANSEKQIFTNKEENIVSDIEYIGEAKSNFKSLKISNQGDIVAFRYSNANVSSYESNEEETINHNELLKKTNISADDIKAILNFDITIKLESGKEFKANVNLDVPAGDIIDTGSANNEITDMSNIIFKRIKN